MVLIEGRLGRGSSLRVGWGGDLDCASLGEEDSLRVGWGGDRHCGSVEERGPRFWSVILIAGRLRRRSSLQVGWAGVGSHWVVQ